MTQHPVFFRASSKQEIRARERGRGAASEETEGNTKDPPLSKGIFGKDAIVPGQGKGKALLPRERGEEKVSKRLPLN